ncbi:TPA: TniB family NTP-binding protein [Burkholderia cenocepacia]
MSYSDQAIQAGIRIEGVRVHHTKFKRALDAIARVIQIGNSVSMTTGVSVIAPAGSGKTLLIESVKQNVCRWPFLPPNSVLCASLKESPSVSQVQDELLAGLNYVIPPRSVRRNNTISFDLLVEAVDHHGIRLIAIDEYQHVFLARKTDARADMIDWTKRLMTKTKCPVLLAGTETLRSIEKGDPQLSSRVPTVLALPAFENDEEWRGMLTAFSSAVPEVNLAPLCTDYATTMFRATRGMMRMLKALIIEVSMIAIDNGEGQVTKQHLQIAFNRVYGDDSSLPNPFV